MPYELPAGVCITPADPLELVAPPSQPDLVVIHPPELAGTNLFVSADFETFLREVLGAL